MVYLLGRKNNCARKLWFTDSFFDSLFGAMFPLPRIIYAMASDGLVFRFLGDVSPRFQTPVVGTLLAGLLTGMFLIDFSYSITNLVLIVDKET